VTPGPEPLTTTPPRLRRATLLVMVITSLMGLMAAAEAIGLGSIHELRQRIRDDAPKSAFLGDPDLLVAVNDAQMAALEGMKVSRGVVLGGVASACMVGFFAAMRLLRPEGVAREGVRRVLVVSLLTAAVLRTVDGAQWAVVAQRSMRAAVAHLQQSDPGTGGANLEQLTQPLTLTLVLAHTAIVVGLLLLLGQYFRSEKVKQLVALQDQHLEQ
jgi:hypothetical protein